MKYRRLASLPIVALVLVSPFACSRGKQAPAGGSDIPPSKVNLKRNVELIPVVQRSLTYTVDTVGLIEAEGQTDLAAGVPGLVDEVNFREGDMVHPDQAQPLVRISQPLYEAAVKVAQFDVQRAESRAAEAQKLLELARKNWETLSESERLQRQFAVTLSAAEVSAAKAAYDRANYNLRRSQLRPPYRGRINRRLVTLGSYVEERTVIATIADLSHLRITTYIPESATSQLRDLMDHRDKNFRMAGLVGGLVVGGSMPADISSSFDLEFTVLPFPKQRFKARIFYLSTVGDPATHQFECKAQIVLPPDAPALLPGFTARVRVPLETKDNAVLIPEESLRSTERGWLVFTPEKRVGRDGNAEWLAKAIRVEPGYRSDGWVEIRAGLIGNELVVRRGADALDEDGGTPLKIPDHQIEILNRQ